VVRISEDSSDILNQEKGRETIHIFMEHMYVVSPWTSLILFSLLIVFGSTVKEIITPPDVEHPIVDQATSRNYRLQTAALSVTR
jgi:hypothetical protein